MKETKGLWLSRKVDNRNVFIRVSPAPASTFKTLPETWGIRFDIEAGLKHCRQSL
jgi:cold shock CspA family protein